MPSAKVELEALGAESELGSRPLLDIEPDWAAAVPEEDRDRARRLTRVRRVRVPAGPWNPVAWRGSPDYGLLVVSGLLVRRVRVGRASSLELLGPGDILRPAFRPLAESVLPPEVTWKVLYSVELAVLDERITRCAGYWPLLGLALSDRLLRRARNGAFLMAVGHFVTVEDRVLGSLWHMAYQWGRVTSDGVVVPFRLTHEMLAEIVGAQRPTVSTALSRLQRRGAIARSPDRTFVLTGGPPAWPTEASATALVEV